LAQINVLITGSVQKTSLEAALNDLLARSVADFEVVVSEESEAKGITILIEIPNLKSALLGLNAGAESLAAPEQERRTPGNPFILGTGLHGIAAKITEIFTWNKTSVGR
jgi:hypothetical protein